MLLIDTGILYYTGNIIESTASTLLLSLPNMQQFNYQTRLW